MIADKQGPTAQKTAHDGKRSIEHRQAEGYKRYYDGKQRRTLLRGVNGQGCQDKSQEKAAGIAQENRGRRKIKSQESEQRTGQCDGQNANKVVTLDQRNHKDRKGNEEGDTRGQAVQSVNKVERIGHRNDPEHSEDQAQEETVDAVAKDGQVNDAQARPPNHPCCECLNY